MVNNSFLSGPSKRRRPTGHNKHPQEITEASIEEGGGGEETTHYGKRVGRDRRSIGRAVDELRADSSFFDVMDLSIIGTAQQTHTSPRDSVNTSIGGVAYNRAHSSSAEKPDRKGRDVRGVVPWPCECTSDAGSISGLAQTTQPVSNSFTSNSSTRRVKQVIELTSRQVIVNQGAHHCGVQVTAVDRDANLASLGMKGEAKSLQTHFHPDRAETGLLSGGNDLPDLDR
ncbi:hypothetical protein M426DRAFT_12053 [Hypoxylon sp. CI-4A]|nr:hypothetical protein M426DRAFT_12053 [Hypoxylon sp. CI-4A]